VSDPQRTPRSAQFMGACAILSGAHCPVAGSDRAIAAGGVAKMQARAAPDRDQCCSGAASAAQIVSLRCMSAASTSVLPAALAFSISSRMLASACSNEVMAFSLGV
jgi:hypothetical protein